MKKDQNLEQNVNIDAEDQARLSQEPETDGITDAPDADPFEVLEKLKAENEKLKDDYLRAYAETENIKRRAQQELEKNSKYAVAGFAKDLLSVADNLERAVAAATDTKDCETLLKGIELTQAELTKTFEKAGITKMNVLGAVFNPAYHHAVEEIEDKTNPSGTIIKELQPGYLLNDRILREAMVVVTKQ